jgi:hypothetical protein
MHYESEIEYLIETTTVNNKTLKYARLTPTSNILTAAYSSRYFKIKRPCMSLKAKNVIDNCKKSKQVVSI